jgi:NADH-quinone oxidoreductase subunit A
VGQYLPVVALLVLAVLFSTISFLASKILAPRRMTLAKRAPYESGIVPGKDPPQRFPVRFYLVAMIFIVFDIEIIFLYPWAVTHRELGLFGLVAVVIFAASVFESFLYLLSKGALEWGPIRRVPPRAGMIGAQRTAASTIRRVGTEGRYGPAEQEVLAELADRGELDELADRDERGGLADRGERGDRAEVGELGEADGPPDDDRSSASPTHTGVQ